MPALLELLRPPPHRGPLIAAGAVLLTLGLGLIELRLGGSIAAGVQLLFLAAGDRGRPRARRAGAQRGGPPARVPVRAARLRAAAALPGAAAARRRARRRAPAGRAGTIVWTGAVMTAVVGLDRAARCHSAICALIAAVAAGVTLRRGGALDLPSGLVHALALAAAVLAIVLVLLALWLRGRYPRHAELLIDGAALAILAIAIEAIVTSVIGSSGSSAARRRRRCPGSGSWSCSPRAAGWWPTGRSTARRGPRGSASRTSAPSSRRRRSATTPCAGGRRS